MTRFRARPSKRDVKNTLAVYEWMSNAKEGDAAPEMEAPTKRGPQKEGLVNEDIAGWRNRTPRVFLERNKKRLAVPVGGSYPVMLGWGRPDGTGGEPDWVGDTSVVITAAMVGMRVAIATYIEAKTEDGVLSKAQEQFLNAAKDRGAIAGVARSAEEADDVIRRWEEGK